MESSNAGVKFGLVMLAFMLPFVGCVKRAPEPRTSAVKPGVPRHWDVGDEKLKNPLPEDMADGYLEFARAPGFSYGLTMAHDSISARSHERHDLLIYVHWGSAVFHAGDEKFYAATGDMVYIPRGTVYSATRTGRLPLELITVYSPPFDRDDIVYQEPEAARQVTPPKPEKKELKVEKKVKIPVKE